MSMHLDGIISSVVRGSRDFRSLMTETHAKSG